MASQYSDFADRKGLEAASAAAAALGACIRFRNMTLVPAQRLLLRDGQPVDIGSRAFDLLVVLARSSGAVVQKREIVDYVWPSTIVDESNLRFQMAALRRALGEDRDVIKTIQGRGYMFVGGALGAEVAPTVEVLIPSAAETTDLSPGAARRTPPAVAVIEDDDDTREALDGLLRSSGLVPHCFATPQAFMKSSASSSARCVVLDVCLPGGSGLDFHADMRRAGIQLPVIFISGHADVPMSVRAMKAGAVEFLTKPVRHEELLRAVNDAVELRSA